MNLLKKENWWIWLLLTFISGGASSVVLGSMLDCFDKKAWYANYKYWLIGIICLFFPFAIMITVFTIQFTCLTAAKLEVPGKEIYLSPYIWIVCLIVPIIGWAMFIIMSIYLEIWTLVSLYRGNGEKYLR